MFVSAATFWHRILRGQAAVAQPPGPPDVPPLAPLLPPAVPQQPELAPVAVLPIAQGCHRVAVLVLLLQGRPIEEDATMFRKQLSTICFTNLVARLSNVILSYEVMGIAKVKIMSFM